MGEDKRNIRVGWVQIGESFGSQYYLPYSVGLLESYARKYLPQPDRYEFVPPIYRRISLPEAASHLGGAGIVFFSAYLWNFRNSLAIAAGLKQKSPETLIVFGGPQIPETAEALEAFLRRYPFIDVGCRGEGEIPVLKLLEQYETRSWEEVPSIGYLGSRGVFVLNPMADRISDLDSIPSPYLTGTFDRLMEDNPHMRWSAMWETNRGCPFSCAFCAWGAGDKKKVYHYVMKRLSAEIDWFSEKKIEFIFCCDANYGMFERDLTIARKVAENKRQTGYPQAFSVQNTKNSTKKIFELQKTLNDAGLQKGVNLALQSLHEPTLKSIRRANIRGDVYRELQRIFTQAGIPTFSDILLGLPEETYETLTDGASSLIESGQHNKIQFINLAVLENTALAQKAYQETYGLILRESEVIPHHAGLADEGIRELQHLVVGTKSMPKERWADSRVFAWMITLMHFNKLLQVPFILLNRTCGVTYKALTEVFLKADEQFPCLAGIYRFFHEKAIDIQNGGPEHVASREWLNIWWPADEYILIRLCRDGKLSSFYAEAEAVLERFLTENRLHCPEGLLAEAMALNRALIKEPFVSEDLELLQTWNAFEVYRGALVDQEVPLVKGQYRYRIDRSNQAWPSWEEWFRDVVWYGTKRGAFLYPCTRTLPDREKNGPA
jgi:radical SAM superfamily enzyme YgiQ (UPF0313 family)